MCLACVYGGELGAILSVGNVCQGCVWRGSLHIYHISTSGWPWNVVHSIREALVCRVYYYKYPV